MRLLRSITPHRQLAKIGDVARSQKLGTEALPPTATNQASRNTSFKKLLFLCLIWPPADSQGTISKIDMAKLTKRDIVVSISNQTGMVQHQVFDVVQKTLDKITDELATDISVDLRSFGLFLPRLTLFRLSMNLY